MASRTALLATGRVAARSIGRRAPPSVLASTSRLPPRSSFASSSRRHDSALDQFNIFTAAETEATAVSSVSPLYFTLTSSLVVPSPMIILNGRALMWDVPPAPDPAVTALGRGGGAAAGAWEGEGWREEMFKVFEVVSPRPEMLILGTGERMVQPPHWLHKYLNNLGIQLNVLDTKNAASTFNMLADEGRRVAAALLTLVPMDARTGQKRIR